MTSLQRLSAFTLTWLATLLPGPLQATDGRLDLSAHQGQYQDSARYERIRIGTVMASLDNRHFGGTVGYSKTAIAGGPAGADLDQDDVYLSGRARWFTRAGARSQLRLDGYWIGNDDASGMSDDVQALGGFVDHSPADGTWWVAFGGIHSDYRNVDLTLTQWNPALGFAFNNQWDWLQLRGYFIHSDNPLWTQNEDDTTALELSWTHWFRPAAEPGFSQLRLKAVLGERILAYDPDAASLNNRPDLQTAGYSLSGSWHFGGGTRLLIALGRDEFSNRWLPEDYVNHHLTANLSLSW